MSAWPLDSELPTCFTSYYYTKILDFAQLFTVNVCAAGRRLFGYFNHYNVNIHALSHI